jgi:excisionase family DNA binding protein
MPGQSYRVSEAANLLGVSVPTLNSLVRDKKLRAFRTPGGQLRILADSLEQVQQGPALRPVREVSPVLQNRRERVEELALEAQELRAGHEIRKLRQEDAAEARQKREERQERAREAEQEAQRLELEQQQLEIERHERAERARDQAALRDFRARWLAHADTHLEGVALYHAWLTPPQRKEIMEALEAEIGKHATDDEQRMKRIVEQTLASLVAPLQAQREIARRREEAVDRIRLGFGATQDERVRARALAHEAVKQMPLDATPDELLSKVQDAIAPICHAIEEREADEKREASKQDFIRRAFITVRSYKQQLRDEGEISRHDYTDQAMWQEIEEDVKEKLARELTGDESPEEVEGLVCGMVDDTFNLESPEEDQG